MEAEHGRSRTAARQPRRASHGTGRATRGFARRSPASAAGRMTGPARSGALRTPAPAVADRSS